MIKELNDLFPPFKTKVEQLLKNCLARGVVMIPYETVRSLEKQATYYRRGRSHEQVIAAISSLKANGANYIASTLENVGPQDGDKVTNALPGQGWHQYGMAVDCYWLVNGKDNWDGNATGYKVYAEEAKKLGLTAGFYWKFKDSVHVQLSPLSKPPFDWKTIDLMMWMMFGDK
jgi:peptidoglycan LD-endopeptidase CwlK